MLIKIGETRWIKAKTIDALKTYQRGIKKQWDVCVYTDRETCVYDQIRRMLDIADIKTSARLMLLVVEIVELQADLKALESLVQMQYDSHAVDAAKNHVRQQPEYMEINNELKKATEAVAKAMSDPEARLRAMFNAKIRGDM